MLQTDNIFVVIICASKRKSMLSFQKNVIWSYIITLYMACACNLTNCSLTLSSLIIFLQLNIIKKQYFTRIAHSLHLLLYSFFNPNTINMIEKPFSTIFFILCLSSYNFSSTKQHKHYRETIFYSYFSLSSCLIIFHQFKHHQEISTLISLSLTHNLFSILPLLVNGETWYIVLASVFNLIKINFNWSSHKLHWHFRLDKHLFIFNHFYFLKCYWCQRVSVSVMINVCIKCQCMKLT